ncbi:hypothetical protein COLO4_16362 [Corchorus olitorius]|uniref:Retrotransposon gag protein n=1 Tax=Corchorus olitorius TaxID=93759 RepID=A0A1R3JHS3_9ROSI|nr:hypothetical protein COLO4_16362 [Corchorus olitorius]
MERKPTETITEYAQRWRDATSQVHPAVSDKEQARLFINTFKPPYYGYLLSGITKGFADLVVLGEMIDISIKNGKLEGRESASTKKNQWTKKKKGKVQATFNHSNQYPRPVEDLTINVLEDGDAGASGKDSIFYLKAPVNNWEVMEWPISMDTM